MQQYENSFSPIIRCIALDLGGVYFDGNIDSFYDFLDNKYHIRIKKKRRDRLNIDDKLMLGQINILSYIQRNSKVPLTSTMKDEILEKWKTTWTPNPDMIKIISDISRYGFHVIPFSNLDSINGQMYIRERKVPECCTEWFFSYEQKKAKPYMNAFSAFEIIAREKGYITYGYQILLIDDENENINTAQRLGWSAIKYYNGTDNVNSLVGKLKNHGILPYDYIWA